MADSLLDSLTDKELEEYNKYCEYKKHHTKRYYYNRDSEPIE